MASTKYATNLSGVLASLSESLADFRAESSEIESKFFELVDELGGFVPVTEAAAAETTTTLDSNDLDSIAVEQLENLDRSIAEQRAEMAGKQDQLSDDVGQLRELVDRQTQLFATLVGSSAKAKKGNASRKGNRKNASEDEILNEVFAQFEELRGAAAAVRELPAS